MVSNNSLTELLESNPRLADALDSGGCYDPKYENGRLVGFDKTECTGQQRPVTVTESSPGRFQVSSGHLSQFSGDGQPAKHLGINADQAEEEDQVRVMSSGGTGLAGDKESAKVVPASQSDSGTGLEEDPEVDAYIAKLKQ